jgi:undecaprenyl phosphate-alpha-L-ara4N flippase subunit ArnE
MQWDKLVEVLVVVSLTSSGQLLLRQGMRAFQPDGQGVLAMLGYILRTPALWLGIGLYGVSTLLWMRVLARYPVSAVYPMVAIGYIFVTLGGIFFLGERVSVQGWIALAVICFGVLLLASAPSENAT